MFTAKCIYSSYFNVVLSSFTEAISNYDGGVRVVDPSNMTATAGIFATYPAGYLSVGEGLADQVCADHCGAMSTIGQTFCQIRILHGKSKNQLYHSKSPLFYNM